MLKLFEKNKYNCIAISFIVLIIILVLLKKINLQMRLSNNQQVGILTLNSIITGFLFSGLSLFVSNSDKPRIIRLDSGGYLDDYYNGIYLSMIFNMISIILGAILLISGNIICKGILMAIEQISLYASLILYIKTLIRLIRFSEKARNE